MGDIQQSNFQTDFDAYNSLPSPPVGPSSAIPASHPSLPMINGILDPQVVEQSGITTTGNASARTDTMTGTSANMEIDVEHEWIASQLDLEVWNLQSLYVINGTFDEGIPGSTINPNGTLTNYPYGWSAVSTDGNESSQVQRVSYDDSGRKYVSAQNQGKLTNPGQGIYTHYAGTSIFWNQTFSVSPYTEDFLLSFDYLYAQGPLGTVTGDCSLKVRINGVSIWSLSLPSVAGRGVWYSTGVVPVNLVIPSSRATLEIGLMIDSKMDIYDNVDGAINAEMISIYLDDISLVGSVPPEFDDVGLEISVGSLTSVVEGTSGTGTSTIVNASYWSVSSLVFSLAATKAVSFEYKADLLHHRFLNTSATMDPLNEGGSYTVEAGQSGHLEFYTYLGFLDLYDGLVLRIYHPPDWENGTVYDPFLVNVSGLCTETPVYIEVPTNLLDRLGWWKITFDLPNYAYESTVERYDSLAEDWVVSSIFHSPDSVRLTATIGHEGIFPIISDALIFTWYLPNGTKWNEESSSIVEGITVQSLPSVLGGANTSAGEWCATFFWSNGSEIAYGQDTFTLHHEAVLEPLFGDVFETVVGQPVTIIVTLTDSDNGQLILNAGAQVIGNWSDSVVEFRANLAANWWEADFDTVTVGAGDFVVVIASAVPYYETTPLIITIRSQFLTNLDTPTGPLVPLTYGREYSFDFFYSISLNDSGIEGADVTVSQEGSQWASVQDLGDGDYRLLVTPLGTRDYSIRLGFWKEGYEAQSYVLSFLVERVPVKVSLVGSLIGTENQPFLIRVNVTESDTGSPVENATVTLGLYPEVGSAFLVVNMTESDLGIYSAWIDMPPADGSNYQIRVSVSKDNYELDDVFTSSLLPTVDAGARFAEMLYAYSIDIGLLTAVIGSVLLGRRAYLRKKKAKTQEAMEFKRRFDDANNLLGFIVLHKLSGVPVYSKMLKGGLEEGMLSAFITAIMHFRAEIEGGSETDEYSVMPVSDIIRTVATRSLICAFITITSPSKEQEHRMKEFARAVAMMMDEDLAERPAQVVDPRTARTFEWMFDEFMDGLLVRRYELAEGPLPKRFRSIEDAVSEIGERETFTLVQLLRTLTSSGYGESDAYLLVQNAVENEYVIPLRNLENSLDFSEVDTDTKGTSVSHGA